MDSAHALLYVVATPIGNLEDITCRARRILTKVSHFISEDTRESRKLFELLSIPTDGKRFFSYAAHNMKQATHAALKLLAEGNDLALLSDRGTPLISDPGALLVNQARENGYLVVPVPGVSCLTAAFSVSGIESSQFLFTGFIPRDSAPRREFFDLLKSATYPVCFLESPRRIRGTLADLKKECSEGKVFIAREITKQFETLAWHTLSRLDIESIPEIGEFTIIFLGGVEKKIATDELKKAIGLKLASDKEWAKEVAKALGFSSNTAYNALQKDRRGDQ